MLKYLMHWGIFNANRQNFILISFSKDTVENVVNNVSLNFKYFDVKLSNKYIQ